jgi:hypothetical protein
MQLMRMRIIFAVVMAVLLVAGTTASAMCEMTCLPQAQTSACCPHHAQQMVMHCHQHSETASLVNAHTCEHPQDSAAVAVSIVAAPPVLSGVIMDTNLVRAPVFHAHLSLASILKPLNPPLRI